MASLRSANVCRTASSSLLSLTQSLTTPNKLVHLFDWKKATSNVLVVRITKQSMECAIASHPTTLVKRDTSSSSIQSFTSIPLQREKSISSSSGTSSDHQLTSSSASSSPASFNVSMVTQSLQQLMKEHHVCGVIVLYPTTGPIGMKNASCGRTLHVLDHIQLPLMNAVSSTGSALRNTTKTTTTSSTSSTTTKPICLYDPNHYQTDMMEDEWGRTPLYSRTTAIPSSSSTSKSNEKVMVRCGQIAQSDTNSYTILEQTWKNFCHHYWPSSSDIEESDNSDNDDVLLTNFMNKVSHQKNHFQMNQQHQQHHNNIDNTATVSPVYQSAF